MVDELLLDDRCHVRCLHVGIRKLTEIFHLVFYGEPLVSEGSEGGPIDFVVK